MSPTSNHPVRPFWNCQASEMVAVLRQTQGKAQTFAQRVPITTTTTGNHCVGYDNVQDFLQHPALETVLICSRTRPESHLAMAGQLVAAAGKDCYILKNQWVNVPLKRCKTFNAFKSQQFHYVSLISVAPIHELKRSITRYSRMVRLARTFPKFSIVC